jgi:U6 snRNA-associated Sm-like protein LSm8
MSLQTFVNSTYAPLAGHLAPSFSFLTVDYLEKILVITADGRTLVGTLLSCDQLTNIVLNETIERIIRPQDDPEPSSEVSHGLYLVRGDNITICGLVDKDLDNSINWAEVRGEVIGGTKHV